MVGDQPIRSVESAEYFIDWIDELKAMAENDPFWRSSEEKRHVFDQFDEARQVYLMRRDEAREQSEDTAGLGHRIDFPLHPLQRVLRVATSN